MDMVYVNRNTGEIFDAEKVTLSNLCGGWISDQFNSDLSLLARRMEQEDKGSITIKIIVQKKFDGEGSECLYIGAESSLELPKVKMADQKAKHIKDDGEVVNKGDRKSLFDDYTDESHQIEG